MDAAEARAGLCATCRFHRLVAGARSTFYRCEKSFSDPRFARYPALPVVQCVGYVRATRDEAQSEAKPEKTK